MKNIEINKKIKEMINKLDKSDEILNLSVILEKLIKYAGERYIDINLDKDSDDPFLDKCFLAEEFEERLKNEFLCECDNIYF